ncbi:uncharacterized protein B0I36DRAFT_83020 [Microdochium trichocladiopsis]|uniref:Uncharacterized protein n=1 Tax=Microdochium trichocladiopsis TaxID=1682393 RepID=A0A9P8YAG1_9PEZI|nr:uncharacterized protein B0I36DRAFT_83020 [Microdochium trichocladiopsis]KAH7034672.1 hypothetical protein B0I36DRAFT_83020 [Microdochium trichocladiopsis]
MHFSTLLTSAALVVMARAATHSPDLTTDDSSGTEGVLSKFDDELLPMSRIQLAAISAPLAREDGSFTTCLPVLGGANVEDCSTVLSNIAANTNDIGVAPGFCLNWWSGTCLAKICARGDGFVNLTEPYYEKPSVVVERLGGDPLGVCVAKGDSGVVSDCPDYAGDCGVYRYYLQIRQ